MLDRERILAKVAEHAKPAAISPASWGVKAGEYKRSKFHSGRRIPQLAVGFFNEGWEADDAKTGTNGRVYVFSYNSNWEKKYFEEKEVRVYYKLIEAELMLLTVKERYGKSFPRKGGNKIK